MVISTSSYEPGVFAIVIIIQEISQEEVETTTSDANKVTREQSGQSHAYSDSSYSGRPSRREHSVYYLINRIADAFRLLP